MEHASGVKHTAQGFGRLHSGKRRGELLLSLGSSGPGGRQVTGEQGAAHPLPLQLGQQRSGASARSGGRARQHQQRCGALIRQPLHELQTQPPQCTGHQVGGVSQHGGSRKRLDRHGVRVGDHNLANVAGLGHQPEGLNRLGDGKFLDRQQLVAAGHEVGHQLLKQHAHQLGLGGRHLQ